METRLTAVLDRGMSAVVGTVMSRFFTPSSLDRDPPVVAAARRILHSTSPVG
jgi:hypothetical protein